jgi:hypothetical protein
MILSLLSKHPTTRPLLICRLAWAREVLADEAAEGALKKLNSRDIKGRPIRVNEAQARSGGGGAGGGGERRGGRGV